MTEPESLKSPSAIVPPPGSSDTAALEQARADLAAIVDSSEDAIASKTLEGIVTSWNSAAERLFGWTAAEMIGQPILRVIPPELHYEEADILQKLRRGERIERYEMVRVHKSGRRLQISLTVSPIRDPAGQVVGAAKIAHDITARREAERALQENAHALETLNRVGQAVAAQLELDRIPIVKNLVELHGGSVRVKSPGENLGSTFVVVLPVSHVQREEATRALRPSVASDPLPRSAPIPAIAITAYTRAEDRQRSLLAGYHMHLSKPLEAPELIAGIASLLRLTR